VTRPDHKDLDALDILARIDGGQPATGQELGYLLPELERRGHIKVEMVERCCKKISARIYRYRGRQFLWVGGHLGNYPTGIAPVPAVAGAITPDLKTPTFLAITTCRKCGCGLVLILESPMTIRIVPGPPPTFATVVD
jgi:hypothetical protein